MKNSIVVAAALTAGVSASLYGESNLNHTCQLVPDYLSCSADAVPSKADSCCVETYGGLFLQTQFWDTYTGLESQGQLLPADSWTIHGLWPDFCNGSYTQYCDLTRQYDPFPSPNTTNGLPNGTVVPPYNGTDITAFVTPFGRYDLLAYMNKYWIGQNQKNWILWAHEFSKHATCFSTFDLPCYGPQYVKHYDLVDFFETTVKYFLRLPTYDWLADAGIEPSNSTTYTLKKMEKALKREYRATPYLGCSGPRYNATAAGAGSLDNGRTELSEVWYYFHAYGRPQDGNSVPVEQTGKSSCATTKGAIKYYERAANAVAGGSNSTAPGQYRS
ncbi:hypothetical protein B0A48_00497 [Cryoendolithus antarcticus]|uniref:ribonuclease T2 n=1 Tax=Cryoendolithus antarcticus TaxID=1507870 RepID=A0A1V8TUP0_9PEZI|nr:hypothetical protein B0A48_00497 [Cryoendolithus antarcticus]